MSKLCSAPRWTPPMPPVAKTLMPASAAASIVAATVVPPVRPAEMAKARSARESFIAPEDFASSASSGADSPIFSRPFRMAIVAGTAPSSRMIASTFAAMSAFAGKGMPWVMMVDSSATTGLPPRSASETSAEMSTKSGSSDIGLFLMAIHHFQKFGEARIFQQPDGGVAVLDVCDGGGNAGSHRRDKTLCPASSSRP